MTPNERPLIERQAEAWLNRANQVVRRTEFMNREPCFRCGIRGELGCRHTRRAA